MGLGLQSSSAKASPPSPGPWGVPPCPAHSLVLRVQLDVGEEVGVPMGDAVPVHVLQPDNLARKQQECGHPFPQSHECVWGTLLTFRAAMSSSFSEWSLGSIRASAVTTCKRHQRQRLGGRHPSSQDISPLRPHQHLRHTLVECQVGCTPGLVVPPCLRPLSRGSLRWAGFPGRTEHPQQKHKSGLGTLAVGKSKEDWGGDMRGRRLGPGAQAYLHTASGRLQHATHPG